MIFHETILKGAFVVEFELFYDDRGFFGRTWCANEMKNHGLNVNLRQANVSFNKQKGTLRGMHYQIAPYQETKLVRCSRGSIFDVIIDLRVGSPTFRKWFGIELSQDNHKMLYVPEDFAHGFITLEDNTELNYLMTEFFVPGAGATIRWNDPAFDIKWPLEPTVMSEKDRLQTNYNILPI